MANRISQVAVEVAETGFTAAARVSQVAVEVAETGFTAAARVSQVAVEVVFELTSEQLLDDGSTIATAESFGLGVVAGPLTGVDTIASSESFEIGTLTATNQFVGGVATIPSEEAFGFGVIAGPLTGASPIASAEFFAAGLLKYDQAITPGATIASGETFGVGTVAFQLTGDTIPTAESFGLGALAFAIAGYDPIPTAESFFRGGLVAREKDFLLFIRGIDRSSWLKTGSMNVAEELDGRASASFEINTAGHPARSVFRPNPYDEVVYMFGGHRKFGGFVQDYEERALDGRSDLVISVKCVDYRQLADDRVFSKVYTGPTFSAKAIIKEIWQATLRQEGITWNEGLQEDVVVTGSRFVLNDVPVGEAFDRVCAAFGMSWRITRFRELKIVRASWELAPRVIRDNDKHTRDMRVQRSSRLNRTRQGIRTGVPVAGQRESSIVGNGTHEYRLGYAITEKPTVEVNGTPADVIRWEDRTLFPYDFAYEIGSNVLRHNAAQAAYTGSDDIVVTHPSDTLDVYWVDDTAAIARLAARTGGSGIVEIIRQAREVRDFDTAVQICTSELEVNGASAESISWEEDEFAPSFQFYRGPKNWAVGQILQVFRSAPLVAGMYVVQSIKMQEVDGTFLRYNITAVSRELPMIIGVEVDPEGGTITIEVDRPVNIPAGGPIEIWGGGGLEPIWGNPTIGGGGIDGSGGNTLTFKIPPGVDPGDLSYYGGLGGVNAGLGGGGLGTNGLGGAGSGFGGYIFAGIPPEGGPGSTLTSANALVIVNVNRNTNEVTLDQAHGWSSSGTGNFRVAIFGVQGCDAPNGSKINTHTTRITVTAPNRFVADDVGDISGSPGFVNDGHGRAISTNDIIRVTPGTSELAGLRQGFAQSAYAPNNDVDKATFLLASAIPGVASRPIATGTNVTNGWEAQKDLSVVHSVVGRFETPPTGDNVIIDIKQNGVSIFADASGLTIPAGSNETVRVSSGFRENPLQIRQGDQFTLDVTQVGSEFPGCGGTVIMNTKG